MLKGKGVSGGIGLGKVVLLKEEQLSTQDFKIEDVKSEIQIFQNALNEVINETEELINKLSGTQKEIMQAYLMILQDPTLIQETMQLIEKQKYNVAYATDKGFDVVIQMFETMNDPYMSARAADIVDMKKKVLGKLLQKESNDLSNLPAGSIIVAKEMTTSDTSKLNLKNIAGIVTELGGINSHVSIMARTHEVPAIVGIKQATDVLKENDIIAINGTTGEIFVNPSKEECIKLGELKEKLKKEKEELEPYKKKATITKDGHKVELLANIGVPQDAEIAVNFASEGVGLMRSEFLYMNSENFPTEEEQFQAYQKVAMQFQEKRVIIRTLDIGGDKDLKYMKLPKEGNPFLGYRAIRISLDNSELFKTQLRAILRASAYGNVAIMLPMISSIEELRDAKKIIQDVKKELGEENIPFKEDIEIGIMIEIPSAAIMAEELAKECDFFSIGTNDLIQYTIAVERGNEKIANLYTKFHPAVIRLIKSAIDGAHKNHIFCGMCGEAASDPFFIPLLVGLELDEFSMNASKILKAKKLIRELDFGECKKLADDVLRLSSAEEVRLKLGKR